ncbi:MAG TPA: phosphate ABC transporter permease PstA [Nitrososphaeraceae archaeon]
MEKIQQKKADLKYQLQNTMERKSSRKRKINKLVTILCIVCVGLAVVPLGSILFEVIKNGISALSVEFLTQKPGSMVSGRGGIGPAIQGTLITIGIASIIAAPVGIFAGIYLAEFAGTGPLPHAIRFFNDVLTGLPSIVLGIVGYIIIVLAIGSFSVWAGSFALSIIMIPIVVRVTEESLKVVPNSIREAGHSLGIPKWKITLHITLKTAFSGVLTGTVIGISRIAGETAPLIMTILGTSLFFTGFDDPVDALPLRIWRLSSQPYDAAHAQGWGAAIILIFIVLLFSVTLRFLAARKGFNVRVLRFSNV